MHLPLHQALVLGAVMMSTRRKYKMPKTLTKFEKLKRGHKKLFPKKFFIECGEGWLELINLVCNYFENKLRNKEVNFIQFAQIKEKFGLLRVYFDLELPTPRKGIDTDKTFNEIHQTISCMEGISGIVCEECGQMKHEGFNVQMRSIGGWRMTRCDECYDKTKKAREERMKE